MNKILRKTMLRLKNRQEEVHKNQENLHEEKNVLIN